MNIKSPDMQKIYQLLIGGSFIFQSNFHLDHCQRFELDAFRVGSGSWLSNRSASRNQTWRRELPPPVQTAVQVLSTIKTISIHSFTCKTEFFYVFSYAGLHCKIVEGYSKGSGYRPGTALDDTFKNQWTAVWVERSWRFINCNWGARFGTKHFLINVKLQQF